MKTMRTAIIARLAWTSCLFGVAGLPSLAHADESGRFVPQQALVRLAPGQTIGAFNARYGTQTLDSIASRRLFLVRLPLAGNEPSDVDAMRSDPGVVFADLNFVMDEENPGGSTQSIFLFRTQAQYQADAAYAAVDIAGAHARATGQGVTVAIIDSGVDVTHPVLAARISPGGFDFIANHPGVTDAGDNVDSNGNGIADEFVGHGTLIAGIIARVAPGAQIMPIRVMDSDGEATTFRVCEGVYHAIDNGAHVINLSMGTTGEPALLRSAVEEARTRGIIVVAAAGNDAVSSPPRTPAAFTSSGVLAVAAVNNSGVIAPFTNFGAWITLSAPGVSVISTVPEGRYGVASGTSFAAPFVTGVAALVRSVCRAAPLSTQIEHLVFSAQSVSAQNPSYPGQLGRGMVNAAAAVDAAMQPFSGCGCPADSDASGAATVEDIFLFLNEWFVGGANADFDGSGAINIEDVFQYLEHWFVGC